MYENLHKTGMIVLGLACVLLLVTYPIYSSLVSDWWANEALTEISYQLMTFYELILFPIVTLLIAIGITLIVVGAIMQRPKSEE